MKSSKPTDRKSAVQMVINVAVQDPWSWVVLRKAQLHLSKSVESTHGGEANHNGKSVIADRNDVAPDRVLCVQFCGTRAPEDGESMLSGMINIPCVRN